MVIFLNKKERTFPLKEVIIILGTEKRNSIIERRF